MNMTNLAVTALRVLLVMAFGLLVVFQTLSLPGQFAYMAEQNPADAYLRWPLTVFAVVEVACVQVVIVSTWKLLTMVRRDRIFSKAALAWVDAIVWAVLTAWILLAGVFVFIVLNADDPGVPMLLTLMLVGGAVIGLLMVVMRALLRQATALRTDMEAVI
ncbi:DUF2975 domain-containing protein [Arthrobacter sp. NPDC056493]|uniref:DUF2975 domain-containing protein n=1 Tax=Arthrobacter sp. NPDC056493 TaxID=3345839 RepID=UPI00366B1661